MVYGLRDGIFFRLLYHHIVLCIDLFLTSHEEGNFNLIPRVSHLPAQAREERGLSSLAWAISLSLGAIFGRFADSLKYFGMLNEILILFI